jgi:hypothetical protein
MPGKPFVTALIPSGEPTTYPLFAARICLFYLPRLRQGEAYPCLALYRFAEHRTNERDDVFLVLASEIEDDLADGCNAR